MDTHNSEEAGSAVGVRSDLAEPPAKPFRPSTTGDVKKPQNKKQLAPLTGLRGVAACSVLIGHGIDTAVLSTT